MFQMLTMRVVFLQRKVLPCAPLAKMVLSVLAV